MRHRPALRLCRLQSAGRAAGHRRRPRPFTAASATAPNRQTVGSVANGANFNSAALPNNYDVVNEAFHPRFPRYDDITNHEKRLGLTGSVQCQPDDQTLFTLDALFADFAVVRNEDYLEAESFSNNNVSNTIAGLGAPILGLGSIGVLNYNVDHDHQQFELCAGHQCGPAVRASPGSSRHALHRNHAGCATTSSATSSRSMVCWASPSPTTTTPSRPR